MPADLEPGVAERCEQLAAAVGAASTGAQADTLLVALRSEAQVAAQRAQLVGANRDTVEELHAMLDGLDGERVELMRGHLRGLRLDAPMPADLVDRVVSARDQAARERDQRFALEVTREVLEGQGYALGEDFVTIVASREGALLPLSGSGRHGVRVRERSGQLLFNVVRFDPEDLHAHEDTAATTAFCETFDEIVGRAESRGLAMRRLTHLPPGTGKVEVRSSSSPFTDASEPARRSTPRERQRPR